MKPLFRSILLGAWVCISAAQATIIQQIGNYGGWGAVQWQPLAGLNDIDNGTAEQLDFVGGGNNPGGYWSIDDSYVYFRMRLDVDTVTSTTFRDAHFVLIDAIGSGVEDGRPDYGFAWDSKSNDPASHGLEMQILNTFTPGGTWDSIRMDDLDGDAGKKLAVDINGGGRTTDGYVQTTDSQLTDAFGLTTFLDFAVSLSYLSNYVPVLANNTNWKIQFASLATSTDHNLLSVDIAGGINPTDVVTTSGWSVTTNIPEPTVVAFIGMGACAMLITRRFFFL